MTEQELKEYIQTYFPRENEKCDWKDWPNLKHAVGAKEKDDIISYVSAFANMNGGSLVLGIEDKTFNVLGIKDFYGYTPENIKLKILDQCVNLPSENLTVEEYKTEDTNKTVWIINIPKHLPRKPVYAHSHAYQRIGDSLVEMRPERLNEIVSEVIISEDWSSKIVPEATIDDLDSEAIEKARKEFKKRNPKYSQQVDAWDDAKFLDKAKITINGKITRTALILLGKEEAEHFISPAVMKIRWSLKTHDNLNKDYEVFAMPMLLAVDKLLAKVRNVKYRLLRPDTLFPDEMLRYDPFTIREPLNNCIAHQDYTKGARIEVVEYEDEKLIFRNAGTFIPHSVEDVVMKDCPESVYRNAFLSDAMRNLNMIETQGGGIRELFLQQKKRFFPMPDYDFADGYVKVTIEGNVLDEKFASLVAAHKDLTLQQIMWLDKVQKNLPITDEQAKDLREQKLIEGRKPHYYLSLGLVKEAGNKKLKQQYIKNRSFDNDFFKKMILDYLKKMGPSDRNSIDGLLTDKLSASLNPEQKKNKIRNLLQSLRRDKKIALAEGKNWIYLAEL